jgi:hypothetical protein
MKTATITYLPKSVKFRKILLQVVKNTSTMTMIFLKLSSISLRINPSMLKQPGFETIDKMEKIRKFRKKREKSGFSHFSLWFKTET